MIEVVLECKPDEALIKAIGFVKKQIMHQANKGDVFNYLERNPGAIGIVDEDPGATWPRHFAKYIFQEEKHDIKIYSNHENRLVVISPRLEEWVIKQANNSNIEPSNYSLPPTGSALHKIINTRIPKFEKMIQDMVASNNAGLAYLKGHLQKKK